MNQVRAITKPFWIFGLMFLVITAVKADWSLSSSYTLGNTPSSAICSGTWTTNYICSNVLDTSSTTYGKTEDGTAYSSGVAYMNYSKITGSTSASLFEVKYGGSVPTHTNLSVPGACWSAYSDRVGIKIESNGSDPVNGWGVAIYCWNGSSYYTIVNAFSPLEDNQRIYSVFMHWSVDNWSSSPSSTCIINDSYVLAANASDKQTYYKYNFSGLGDLARDYLTNIRVNTTAYLVGNDSLYINVTVNKSFAVFIGGDNVNITYSTATVSPNVTATLTLSNFTRINDLYIINRVNENNTVYNQNYNTTLTVYCGTGETTIWVRNNTYRLATNEVPSILRMNVLNVSATQYYREIKPSTNVQNITFYLFDYGASTTYKQYTFYFTEYTESYSSPILTITKNLGSSVTLSRTPFDYSLKTTVYLIGDNYYGFTISDSNKLSNLGEVYLLSSDTSKTIYLSGLNTTNATKTYDIAYNFTENYDSSNLGFIYLDKTSKTNTITYKVYNLSSSTTDPSLIYSSTMTNEGYANFSYTYPNTNDTIKCVATVSHQTYGEFNLSKTIKLYNQSQTQIIDITNLPLNILGLSRENVLILTSITLIAGCLLIFGARFSGIGLIMTALMTSLCSFIGWLPIPPIYLLLIYVVAVLFKLQQGRYVG